MCGADAVARFAMLTDLGELFPELRDLHTSHLLYEVSHLSLLPVPAVTGSHVPVMEMQGPLGVWDVTGPGVAGCLLFAGRRGA